MPSCRSSPPISPAWTNRRLMTDALFLVIERVCIDGFRVLRVPSGRFLLEFGGVGPVAGPESEASTLQGFIAGGFTQVGERRVAPVDEERFHLAETGFELLHEVLNGDRLAVRHGKQSFPVPKSRSGASNTWAARPFRYGSAYSLHAPYFRGHSAGRGPSRPVRCSIAARRARCGDQSGVTACVVPVVPRDSVGGTPRTAGCGFAAANLPGVGCACHLAQSPARCRALPRG